MSSVTRADILCRRSEPNEVAACGRQLAAAKRVATIGRNGQACVEASVGLSRLQAITRRVTTRNVCVRLINAVRVAAGGNSGESESGSHS